MSDNFHSPWNPYSKAGQSSFGRLIYGQEQRAREERARLARQNRSISQSYSGAEMSPFGKKFIGTGLVLFGSWIAPSANSPGDAWTIPGIFLVLGLLMLLVGIFQGRGSGWRPFAATPGVSGWILRFFWFFRPRLWMLAWLMITVVLLAYGSPHLRIQYSTYRCDYYGLNGWETYGIGASCPLVKSFPLR